MRQKSKNLFYKIILLFFLLFLITSCVFYSPSQNSRERISAELDRAANDAQSSALEEASVIAQDTEKELINEDSLPTVGIPQKTDIIAKSPETKNYVLNDEIQAGDFRWKITDFATATQIGEEIYGTLLGVKADGVFLIIDVEVENTGNSAKFLTNSFVILVDEQGREFSPDSAAAIYVGRDGSALLFGQINPGIKKNGKIVFDVPVDLKVVSVKISSNMLGDAINNVKLIL